MLYLLRKKNLILFVCLLFITVSSFAQRPELYQLERDERPYYFSIVFPFSQNRFLMNHHPRFLQNDSVNFVSPQNSFGWGLGLYATLRLSPRWEIRAPVFQLMFVDKTLDYGLKTPDATQDEKPVMRKKVESILLRFPLSVKFNSDRIGNFRVYMIGGVRYDYDFASTARAKRAEELVKLTRTDWGVEGGLGFQFYFPMFTLTPEIKFSQGIRNIHSRDPNLKYSSVIDQMQSRQVIFSVILE